MLKKLSLIGITLLVIGCNNQQKPNICDVEIGTTIIWKERIYTGNTTYYYSYFPYVVEVPTPPLPNSTVQTENTQQVVTTTFEKQIVPNTYCRVDNNELYARLAIGDSVPWGYRGTPVSKN